MSSSDSSADKKIPQALKPWTRREFLKSAGFALGANAFLPYLSVFKPGDVHLSRTTPLKIGVLQATSTLYPEMGSGILNGLQTAVNNTLAPSFSVVTAVAGSNRMEAWRQAETLLQKEQVDLVVGMVSQSVAAWLHPLFAAQERFLIAVHPGANMPRQEEIHPFLFSHTLGGWQAAWALGQWTAVHLGQRALIASSFYDAGYDAAHAFRLGFEAAGQEVVCACVSQVPNQAADFEAVWTAVTQAQPDVVFANYSGQTAVAFVTGFRQRFPKLPLVTTSHTLHETLLPAMGATAVGLISAASWSGEQTSQPFALLGEDTLRYVAAACQAVGGDVSNPEKMRAALTAVQFDSPRGLWQMEASRQISQTPIAIRQVTAKGGRVGHQLVEQVTAVAPTHPSLTNLFQSTRSGWIHEYLG